MQLHAAIDEFVLYIEIEKNYSVNTVMSYEYDLQLFLSFLKDHGCSTNLNEITKTQVRRFIQYQLGSLKQKLRSVKQKISSLKSFAKYCLVERYLTNDFTHGIESPKTDDKLPVYMTLTDLKQLFDYLERAQSRFSMRNELMFKLLATTGIRRSELVSLTWEQVDLVNETIRIDGKGKKNEYCPFIHT